MKIKSTSYPAIALLISLIILISGFAISIFGVNIYLEEKREYGLDLLKDFMNYNYFQFYTYVLSDYEVRRIFFETLYREILSISILNGTLNPWIYNKLLLNNSKINSYLLRCENIFEFVVDNYTDASGNSYTIFLYFPCFEFPPIINFHSEFNKNFVNKLELNYLNSNIFERHAKAIYNYTNFTIDIKQKKFTIKNDDILFSQELEYFYKGKKEKFTRSFNLSVSYSLVPSIILYIKFFAEDYKNILKNALEEIRERNIYNISKFKEYIDGSFRISNEEKTFLVFYKNHSEKSEKLNLLRILYGLYNVSLPIYYKYQEIYLCDELETYSKSVYPMDYEKIYECRVSKTPEKLRLNQNYNYLIETCLYDEYYYLSDYLDESWAEICFYSKETTSETVHILNKFPKAILSPFYGNISYVNSMALLIKEHYEKESDSRYLWPTDELPRYKLEIIWKYVPTKCALGYQYIEGPYIYFNKTECEYKRNELIQQYGRGRNPYIFVSDCEEIVEIVPPPSPWYPLMSNNQKLFTTNKSYDYFTYYRLYVGKRVKVINKENYMICGYKELNPLYFGVYTI